MKRPDFWSWHNWNNARRVHRLERGDQGLGFLGAVRRASQDVHPKIETIVRQQFLLGRYEPAAFAAMREVEASVRDARCATHRRSA